MISLVVCGKIGFRYNFSGHLKVSPVWHRKEGLVRSEKETRQRLEDWKRELEKIERGESNDGEVSEHIKGLILELEWVLGV